MCWVLNIDHSTVVTIWETSLLATTLQKGDLDIDLQQDHFSGVASEDQIQYTNEWLVGPAY